MAHRLPDLAESLRLADPDRYQAAITAAPENRHKLLTLYAFNIEIARAAWVSSEPMINEIRLQWWRDAIDSIYAEEAPETHELLAPLTQMIAQHNLPQGHFNAMIEARRFDIYDEPHADMEAFKSYIRATSSDLTLLAAQVLGATSQETNAMQESAFRAGLANLLRAAPELMARGRKPLPADISGLIAASLKQSKQRFRHEIFPAALTGWRARDTLKSALGNPDWIVAGLLEESPARRRLSFEYHKMTRRI